MQHIPLQLHLIIGGLPVSSCHWPNTTTTASFRTSPGMVYLRIPPDGGEVHSINHSIDCGWLEYLEDRIGAWEHGLKVGIHATLVYKMLGSTDDAGDIHEPTCSQMTAAP